jgi:hypothetical protein
MFRLKSSALSDAQRRVLTVCDEMQERKVRVSCLQDQRRRVGELQHGVERVHGEVRSTDVQLRGACSHSTAAS